MPKSSKKIDKSPLPSSVAPSSSSSKKRSKSKVKDVESSDDESKSTSQKNVQYPVALNPEIAMKLKAEKLLTMLVSSLPYETVGERTKLVLFEAIVQNIAHSDIKKCIDSDLNHFFQVFERELEKLKSSEAETRSDKEGKQAIDEIPLVFKDFCFSMRTLTYLTDTELERYILKSSAEPNNLTADAILTILMSNLSTCAELAPILILNCKSLIASSNSDGGKASNSKPSKNSNKVSNLDISRSICHVLLDRIFVNSSSLKDSPLEIACILAFSIFVPGVSFEKLKSVTCLLTRLNPNISASLIGLIGYFGLTFEGVSSFNFTPEAKLSIEQYISLINRTVCQPVLVPDLAQSFSLEVKGLAVPSAVLCNNWISKVTKNSKGLVSDSQNSSTSIAASLVSILKHIVGNSSNCVDLYSQFFSGDPSEGSLSFQKSYKSVAEFLSHVSTNEACISSILAKFQNELSIADLLQSLDENVEDTADHNEAEVGEEVEEEEVEDGLDITFEIDTGSKESKSSVLDSYLDNSKDSLAPDDNESALSMQVEAALEAEEAPKSSRKGRRLEGSDQSSGHEDKSSRKKKK